MDKIERIAKLMFGWGMPGIEWAGVSPDVKELFTIRACEVLAIAQKLEYDTASDPRLAPRQGLPDLAEPLDPRRCRTCRRITNSTHEAAMCEKRHLLADRAMDAALKATEDRFTAAYDQVLAEIRREPTVEAYEQALTARELRRPSRVFAAALDIQFVSDTSTWRVSLNAGDAEIFGKGKTPEAACEAFDRAWVGK